MDRRLANIVPASAAMAAVCAVAFVAAPRISRAQQGGVLESEVEITARAHLFRDAGLGIRAIKRDSQGRYYFLSSADHAVRVYRSDNTFVGQIPRAASAKTAIIDGQDLDLDSAGRVYVADRGANAVKVYTPEGRLALAIAVDSPTSVAALTSGQVAVASLRSRQLVTIYDAQGKFLREFGDIVDFADHQEFNRLLNAGRLATDAASHVYYAFTYSPEPTVRGYNPAGNPCYEISLHTLDIYPSAQAERRDISRIDAQSAPQPLPVVINAIGVDPKTGEIWLALGDHLMKFDRSGNRVKTYRTLTTTGEDLTASAVLVEPHRILLGDDSHGVFEFARPDLPALPAAKTK
jgi:hypothetical protein